MTATLEREIKLRFESVDAAREAIEQAALAEPNVARFLEGMSVRKLIVVPGKIVNIVAG